MTSWYCFWFQKKSLKNQETTTTKDPKKQTKNTTKINVQQNYPKVKTFWLGTILKNNWPTAIMVQTNLCVCKGGV